MKLLIITAIAEFEKEIKKILKNAKVKTFSFKEVTGYRDSTEDALETNWFATEMNENTSILFYAFVHDESVDSIFKSIEEHNNKQETLSHIHVAVTNIERSN